MILDRVIAPYLCFSYESVQKGLEKINSNSSRIVFAVNSNGQLEGILTDGDFRRTILKDKKIDLNRSVSEIVNREFIYAYETDTYDKINSLFDEFNGVDFVPLVDMHRRLVALARRRKPQLFIDQLVIAEDKPAIVIAEIGNNHNGSIELAYRLVDEAVDAGADIVKFQMRDLGALYSNQGNADDAKEDLGSQYTLDLLKKFQLSNELLFKTFDYCKEKKVIPLCTPWDHPSLDALDAYGMKAFKTASADLTNHDLLISAAKKGKPIIVSTGMSTEEEIIDSVKILNQNGAQYALLHCNSTYPAPFKDLNLRYMQRLKEISKSIIGYSSHDRGYHACVAAVSLGAKIIEKHFTLDRKMEGIDHRVSLEPTEFRQMISSIREIESALGNSQSKKLSQGELLNREVLGKSIFAVSNLPEGTVIQESHLTIKSPGQGIKPYLKDRLVGTVTKRNIKSGECFFDTDIGFSTQKARPYRFQRPFGVPVRFHDFQNIVHKTKLDLVEFHLSYKDINLTLEDYIPKTYDLDFTVHAPEVFENDFIVDLASSDVNTIDRSISEIQRVVDLANQLKKFFPKTSSPRIIVNAGGFSLDHFISKEERTKKYKILADSLKKINQDGVEIILQTMPPFPWHFGGQRYHNLFVLADETVQFSKENNYRICLDISHSKLACNYFETSLIDFVEQVAPFVAHLHISDAEGVDGEGLQLGSGNIDFIALSKKLNQFIPSVSFIPEIWQGHKNDGEAFWFALEQLEKFFNANK